MAPHSSICAWKIPWAEEPGELPSMGSQSQTRLSDFTFTLTVGSLCYPAVYASGIYSHINIELLIFNIELKKYCTSLVAQW